MKHVIRFGVLAVAAAWAGSAAAQESGCMTCHRGIEQFSDGPMQLSVAAVGAAHGDPAGCVTCHGGNPAAMDKEAAHTGSPASLAQAGGPHTFYPDPGAVWIADKSCGQCHRGYAERLAKSLMNTEAGKTRATSGPGACRRA